jgi:hypothetical protein
VEEKTQFKATSWCSLHKYSRGELNSHSGLPDGIFSNPKP